jgi:hypothetical protein
MVWQESEILLQRFRESLRSAFVDQAIEAASRKPSRGQKLRTKVMSIPGIVPSTMTLRRFVAETSGEHCR